MSDLSYPSPPKVEEIPSGKVVHGDSLEYIRTILSNSVDLIVTDPPYGIDYVSNRRKDGNPFGGIVADADPFDLLAHLEEYYRILQDGGAAYLFTRWDVSPEWMRQIEDHGKFQIKNVAVWVKNNHTAGDLEGSYAFKYEQCIFIVKGRHKLRGNRPSDIWKFNKVSSQKMRHPTEKPIKLMRFLIRKSTDEGDVVLDPFSGSGVTAEAAVAERRRFIACEIEEKYVDVIKERLLLFDEKKKQQGEGPGTLSVTDLFGA